MEYLARGGDARAAAAAAAGVSGVPPAGTGTDADAGAGHGYKGRLVVSAGPASRVVSVCMVFLGHINYWLRL